MFYYFLGMTVVVILGTIGAYAARRKLGNSGVETPFVGIALWILLTIFFLGQITTGKPETPENNSGTGDGKTPNAVPNSGARSAFRPAKMRKTPTRYIEYGEDETDSGEIPEENIGGEEEEDPFEAEERRRKRAENAKPYIPRGLVPKSRIPKRKKKKDDEDPPSK
ncbi:MAG: hypothetical protein ACYS8W_03080 [Planctomycetota bacterium]|jgi:hypothetical protein